MPAGQGTCDVAGRARPITAPARASRATDARGSARGRVTRGMVRIAIRICRLPRGQCAASLDAAGTVVDTPGRHRRVRRAQVDRPTAPAVTANETHRPGLRLGVAAVTSPHARPGTYRKAMVFKGPPGEG